MNAVILAAGRGSRMGGLTQSKPKCMVEFQGRQLLSWQTAACVAAGVSRIGAVVGYLKELFEDRELTLFENVRWNATNMVRSLQCADGWLSTELCIVSYSDIFFEPEAIALLLRADCDIGVLYDTNWRSQWEERFEDPLSDAETFRIDAANTVLEIGNRAETIEQIEGQYMGLLRFTPKGWRQTIAYLATLAPETIDKLSMTALLDGLIKAGATVRGVPYSGLWGEIDSESDLRAHEKRMERVGASTFFGPSVPSPA